MPDDTTTGRVTIRLVQTLFGELRRWPTVAEVAEALEEGAPSDAKPADVQRPLIPDTVNPEHYERRKTGA